MTAVIQPTFAAGELAPALHARVDLEKFLAGLATCRNFYVLKHGGVSNRPGTQFIAPVSDHSVRHRLIEFEYNTEQAYVLMFGDQKVWFAKQDGIILEAAQTITGITQASPGVLTVSGHSYVDGEHVYLSQIGGMTELEGQFFKVANAGVNDFTLQDGDGVDIDTTTFTAFTSGGNVQRIYEVATPYTEAQLPTLKYEQTADVMTLTHPSHDIRELTRTGHTSWTLTTLTIGTTVATPAGLAASPSGSTADYTVTAVIGGEESLAATENGGGATPVALTWTAVSGAEYYNVYKQDTGGDFGYIGTSSTNAFTDSGFDPDYTNTPPTEALNPFSGANDKPGTVSFYQERRTFGGSTNNPTRWNMSQSGSYDNFNVSRPVKADDAIDFTLAARRVNEIRHFVPLSQLIILTSGAEWAVRGQGDNGVISPTQPPNAQVQSTRGASHVRPITVNDTVLFVGRLGNVVYDLGFRLETDSYKGDDLTVMATHLFEGQQVEEWTFAEVPNSLIWAVRDDGALLCLTYLREHNIFAWSRHDTGAGDAFESVASIPEGDEDVVYLLVRRTVEGKTRRYLERMRSRRVTEVRDAFFVDSGLTYDAPATITNATAASPVVITTSSAHGVANGDIVSIEDVVGMTELNGGRFKAANVTSTTLELTNLNGENIDGSAYTAYGSGGELRLHVTVLSNLHHLEGRTVSLLGDGGVLTQQVVTGGEVTVSSASGVVHVGLPIEADIESLPLELGQGTVYGNRRNVTGITLLFESSRGGKIGPTSSALNEFKQRSGEPLGTPTALLTGEVSLTLRPSWDNKGKVFFRQSDPLPSTVLAWVPQVAVGGPSP